MATAKRFYVQYLWVRDGAKEDKFSWHLTSKSPISVRLAIFGRSEVQSIDFRACWLEGHACCGDGLVKGED